MTPNIAHQSGHYRAYIEANPMRDEYTLYVMKEDYVVTISDTGVTAMRVPVDGIKLDPETQSMMQWSGTVEDDIVDMWKAIGKALDVYSDEPGQAYKQGYAEGQNQVLRDWNEALRGKE